jgi:basic membrane protein A
MLNQGADVLFNCGGTTGEAAITTAAQADHYVIGVNTDQYLTLPPAAPRMISSAIKLVTPGVFELIKLAQDGDFPNGNYFGHVGYAPFHALDNEVPAEVKTEMDTITAGLQDGSIRTNVSVEKP